MSCVSNLEILKRILPFSLECDNMVNITHVGEHFVNEMPVGDIALEGA